jgi:hypothetical protein
MDDSRKIVWLASYPKSGNTWFRGFLTALFHPEQTQIDINNMHPTTIASSRQLFDEFAGISSADLSLEEIERLRPSVYRLFARESNDIKYQKVHDAWSLTSAGPMFPPEVTRAVIYIIRNPLDVAVSFAHHLNTDIDKTISIMNDPGYAFCNRTNKLPDQLRQKLLTWSGHVKSWVDDSELPLLVIRYEDVQSDPLGSFSRVVEFLGLYYTSKEIDTALEQASFQQMRHQELKNGFSEKSLGSVSFFRKGLVGDWKNILSDKQAEKIVKEHSEIMKRFGYLRDE